LTIIYLFTKTLNPNKLTYKPLVLPMEVIFSFFIGCSPEKKVLQIENPSDTTFENKFEGNQKIVVAPNTKDEIIIPFIKQKIEINGKIIEINLVKQTTY